jgi:hypothetical protein
MSYNKDDMTESLDLLEPISFRIETEKKSIKVNHPSDIHIYSYLARYSKKEYRLLQRYFKLISKL